MPHLLAAFILVFTAWSSAPAPAQDSDLTRRFAALVESVKREAAKRGVPVKVLEDAFRGLEPDPEVAKLTVRQPESVKAIKAYVLANAAETTVKKGRAAAVKWKSTLAAIERKFGVPAAIVVAIWGIETRYGTVTGKKDVLRSLATLAAMNYRGDFFRQELLAVLDMLKAGDVERDNLKGSWAGAMGQAQFMPSSFLAHAVDFDGDGRRDLWGSTPDALASIANYLARKGWKKGLAWGFEVAVPVGYDHMLSRGKSAAWPERGIARVDERPLPKGADWALFYPAGARAPAFLVSANYDAIKAYNNSDHYALSVAHLADRIAGGGAFATEWPDGLMPLPRQARIDLQKRLQGMGLEVSNTEGRIDLELRDTIRQVEKRLGLTPDGNPDAELIEALDRGD